MESNANILPQQILDSILQRSGQKELRNYIQTKDFEFTYGPDIIRGPNGHFYIIEDNLGYVGGQGDLVLAKRSLLARFPKLSPLIENLDPNQFFSKIVEKHHKECPPGEIVLNAKYTNERTADREDQRVEAIFASFGIPSIEIGQKRSRSALPTLYASTKGVFLFRPGQPIKKVGKLIVNIEAEDLDPTHESIHLIRLLHAARSDNDQQSFYSPWKEELEKLMKGDQEGKINLDALEKFYNENDPCLLSLPKEKGVKGLLSAYYKGQIKMTNPPGLEFIGDKEFYIYVEAMIRFYLQEEPLLKILPTDSFHTITQKGDLHFNEPLFEWVFFAEKSKLLRDQKSGWPWRGRCLGRTKVLTKRVSSLKKENQTISACLHRATIYTAVSSRWQAC